MSETKYVQFVRDWKAANLDTVSPTFCLAKWLQVTVHLGTGRTHSCHHPRAHTVGLDEIAVDPGALHNSRQKELERADLVKGIKTSACDYCWRVEQLDPHALSDRHFKSASPWAKDSFQHVVEAIAQGKKVNPTYLEVNMGTTCNMACLYCSPEFSSKWEEDVKRHGGYTVGGQVINDPEWMGRNGYLSIPIKQENPYEAAFLRWWPEVAPGLKVFRLTGGEPLLNRATWAVIDDLIENPRPDLQFGINTNLSVPSALIDKFVAKLNQLHGKVKAVFVYTSAEATGSHQEFIRDGLGWDTFVANVGRIFTETKADLTFMTTINVLSYWTFQDFATWFLCLREKYGERTRSSFNYLRHPEYLSLQVLNQQSRTSFADTLYALADLPAFTSMERENLASVAKWVASGTDSFSLTTAPKLIQFLDQVKVRRNLDYTLVFPGLTACIL